MPSIITLPLQAYPPGTYKFGFVPGISVAVGVTRIRMAFDVSAFLDPNVELSITVERSFNGNAGPWELDFGFTRRGGVSFGDNGVQDTLCYLETNVPQPTNNKRRVRGTISITGGSLTTEGTLTLI